MSEIIAIEEALDWLSGIGDRDFLMVSYLQALRDLSRRTGAFREVRTLPAVAGVQVYTLPASTVQIDQVLADAEEVPKTDAMGLDLVRPAWPTDAGTPIAWLEDQQRQNVFELYPTPTQAGELAAVSRIVPKVSEVPSWVDGLLAMIIAAREASRLGETQDQPLAQALDPIITGLMTLLFVGAEG